MAADQAARRNAVINGASKFLRLLLQVAMLGYGAYLVLADTSLSAGIIFAASIISARALAPADQAVGDWRSLISAHETWRRLRAQLHFAPNGVTPMALPEPDARLSVEKLLLQPSAGGEPILKGLSFSIEPGEVAGIIGPSGAGKSTLARLLVGAITPSSAVVRIGGDDRASWRSEAMGPFIGYVPQDVELFPATVAQNIARMSGFPDPEKVINAARLANCHDLIQRLPQGYERIAETESARIEDASARLTEVRAKRSEIIEQLRAVEDVSERVVVKAPASGTVLGLTKYNSGAVIAPGQEIMPIVPEEAALIVEAQVRPHDIDKVRVGQVARLTFSAFDPHQMPPLAGTVVYISADRLEDERTGAPIIGIAWKSRLSPRLGSIAPGSARTLTPRCSLPPKSERFSIMSPSRSRGR